MTRDIHDSIADAKAEVRRMKEVAPHLFTEYAMLHHAKEEFERAKARLADAQAKWDALGESK